MIESVYLEALPGEFDVEDEFAGGVGAGVDDDDPDGVPRPAEEVLVARVRLFKTAPLLCGRCGQQAPRYDKGSGLRRWRGLDVGTMRSYLEAEAPRVNCPRHGPTVIAMPWARHGARHSRQFDQTVAWLMKFCAKAMLSVFLRIDWKTIGTMLTRVVKETDALRDRWDNVTRIGIDDVSYRRGRLYLMVVVNHDNGELLWAGPGRELATLKAFFDALGEERCKKIKLVSADGADFIANIVAHRLPNAKMCMDPYHVVVWANEALDLVRRRVVREARARGDQAMTKNLQKIRWALLKRPARLTSGQRHKLAVVQNINKHLYRAYLLKEQLRLVFRPGGAERGEDLDAWMRWAHRCKIPEFVELARRMRRYIPDIKNTLAHRLTNAVVEGLNSRIRLAISIARGFRNTDSLIGLITLQLGGYCPDLPGRARRTVRLARS